MGIDVRIQNKKLFKKPLTVAEIKGKYVAGHMDDFYRFEEGIVEGANIIYDPEHIGRGFEFDWNNDLKNEIHLRLNFLSTIYDIKIFYECIKTIMTLWGAKSFEQDGTEVKLEYIDAAKESAIEYNKQYLEMQSDMEEKYANLVILGAMNPIHLECEKIGEFVKNNDLEGYAALLHNLQKEDLYYAVPRIYRVNGKDFFGNYAVTANTDSILPLKASEPPFLKNPDTGNDLKCAFFSVTLVSLEKEGPVGRMSFDDFAKAVDLESLPRYDMNHVILSGLSEERIMELAGMPHVDPLTGEKAG